MLGRFTLPKFEYYTPRTVPDAVSLLRKHRGRAEILAGGTIVLPDLRRGKEKPEATKVLVDINHLQNLQYIKFHRNAGLKIGSLTKIDSIEKSETVRKNYPAILDAARNMGTVQIRNMATIGGNLCCGSQCSDLAVPLLALEAKLVLRGRGKERMMKMDELYAGPGRTRLKEDEILTEIRVPYVKGCGMAFMRYGRTAVDLGLAKVAIALKMDQRGRCSLFRLAVGAATKVPKRIVRAEKLLTGKTPDESWADQIGQILDGEDYFQDWRASAEYRKQLSKVLAKRALKKAIEMVKVR